MKKGLGEKSNRYRVMREIEYILTVANTLNIAKAAESIYISQSALSRYLQGFEKKMGALLFERSAKEIVITECGRMYVAYAEKSRELINEMKIKIEKECGSRVITDTIEMKDFEYAFAVARYKNITKAAASMCISQPALSKYLHNLEEKIGIDLFVRAKDKIRSTRSGRIFVEYGVKIKKLYEEMKETLMLVKQREKKIIRVGLQVNTPKIVTLLVYKKRFEEMYPEYEVLFIDINYLKKAEICDFVIGSYSCQEGYCNIQLNKCFVLLAVNEKKVEKYEPYPQKRRGLPYSWIDLKKIQELDLVIQGEGFRMRENIFSVLDYNDVEYKIQGSVQNSGLALRAVREGVGEAFVLQGIEEEEKTERVHFYCVGEPYMVSTLYLIYRVDMQMNEPRKRLLEDITSLFH